MEKEESNEKRKVNLADNRFAFGNFVHPAGGKGSTVEARKNSAENLG